MLGKKSSKLSMTPSTGGLLAQTSSRANDCLLMGAFSLSGEAVMLKGGASVLELAKVSRVALGDLKLTDNPALGFASVLTVRDGFRGLSGDPSIVPVSLTGVLVLANGMAKSPSSESLSESSSSAGERWKDTSVSSKSNSGPTDFLFWLFDLDTPEEAAGVAGEWLMLVRGGVL